MRILVTGAGQLAQTLRAKYAELGNDVVMLGRNEMDITRYMVVRDIIQDFRPDIVYHTAAWTDVDACEDKPEKAYRVNSLGTRNIAIATERVEAKLVYISSDYVFSGDKGEGYHEFDTPDPISIYGDSKLRGEEYVKDFLKRYFVVRTAWLFADEGRNFPRTIGRLAWEGQDLKVVNDQIGSPTYCNHLVEVLAELTQTELYGTYHLVNSGSTSWFLFAKALLRELGVNPELVKPIASNNLSRKAKRPANSVLISYTSEIAGLPHFPSWRDALREWVKREKASLVLDTR